jgi:hypothetical protein
MCGVCCQNISHIEELNSYDLGNGVCKYFDLDLLTCTIYETRPNICRIDKMYENKYFKKYTKIDFYKLNAEACNSMQEAYNLKTNYRIEIGE